ncbi:MAG: antibiotic biosynthesis monooxygenase [Veillonella sp.]|uniref:putative quinol monooxygenase n=1 Tax=Veillonella caviae TaxID=248316 RepID=UPI000F8C85E2|nr:antibiotic biosynthesis monooxygenase [Veillonella caviae]MCF0158227.1 antibiotic biosynthesis monooxygenase [Veillonella sp.]
MKVILSKRFLLTTVIAILGIGTVSALSFDQQQEFDNAPVVGMYRFVIPSELQDAYNSVGVENLTNSMIQEPNTLSMNVAHVKTNPTTSYVIEIYKDGNALDTHRKSEHFQKYVNEVGSKLTNRKLYDVQPMLLMEKAEPLSAINDNTSVVSMTEFTIDKNEEDTILKQYQLDIERAIRDDVGYKAGYILRDRNNKTYWYVIQIYSDDVAYKKHVSSPGYRFAMGQIQPYLKNFKTEVLQGDILVNHGGQSFLRN